MNTLDEPDPIERFGHDQLVVLAVVQVGRDHLAVRGDVKPAGMASCQWYSVIDRPFDAGHFSAYAGKVHGILPDEFV